MGESRIWLMKRNLILYILGILIFILSVIGLTYAFMKPKVEEKPKSTNISISSCAKVQLKDNGKVINLENTYPMDDDRGLETNPYEFTISSTCEDYIGFNLYLTSLSDNQIADNNIHFAITSKNKDILSEGILASQERGETDFNTKELKELNTGIKGTAKNIYKVYSNNIPFQGESTYQLYLWIDKDAGNDTMGQNFKVGLSVKSYNREETLAEHLINNKDNSLIYHDGVCDYEGEENCDLEADDLSYRFVGLNPNNYICFGHDDDVCPANNLYRIIGFFKNDAGLYETKLIKADYANKDLLGSGTTIPSETLDYNANGSFYNDVYSKTSGTNQEKDGFTHRYRGSLTDVNRYRWQENGATETKADWPTALLNTIHLNHNFLNTFSKQWQDKMVGYKWYYKGNTFGNIVVASKTSSNTIRTTFDYEVGKNADKTLTDSTKIGLMYVSDYLYGASPNNWNKKPYNGTYNYVPGELDSEGNPQGTYEGTDGTDYRSAIDENWMYMGLWEWTITQRTDFSGVNAFVVNDSGIVDTNYVGIRANVVRPCFYLSASTTKLSGNGTKEQPYRLSLN